MATTRVGTDHPASTSPQPSGSAPTPTRRHNMAIIDFIKKIIDFFKGLFGGAAAGGEA
ncbi:MAG: hypothetical protein Q4B10_06780 [Actinomycetaceae bacterium]|nr:hypothetical protein [Actinomycetaceae bacterium]